MLEKCGDGIRIEQVPVIEHAEIQRAFGVLDKDLDIVLCWSNRNIERLQFHAFQRRILAWQVLQSKCHVENKGPVRVPLGSQFLHNTVKRNILTSVRA